MDPTGGHKIAQNTGFLTTAYILQKILAFVYFTLIARWIGAEDLGQYSFAVSFATLFSILMDAGLASVLIRESSKFKEKAQELLGTVLGMKSIAAIVAVLVTVVTLQFLHKSALVELMVYITTGALVLDSFTLSFWGVFRGFQNLRYESIGIVINQVVIVIIGVIGILMGLPLFVLVCALLGGSIFNFCFSVYVTKKKLGLYIRPSWNVSLARELAIIATPFALAGIFSKVYSYIDQILVGTLVGDAALGWYAIAYKITFAFLFIPAAFAGSIYPAMSAYYVQAKEKLVNVFEKSMFFLVVVAVPISVGIGVLADTIVLKLYTEEFAPSIVSLQIWIAALIFVFMSYPVGALLNACDRQRTNTANMGITMVLNVVLNGILIPKYGYVGASIAGLVSWAALLFLNLYWASSIIAYSKTFLLIKTLQALFASAIMGIAVFGIKTQLPLPVVVVCGALIYPAILYAVGGFSKEDVFYIKTSLIKRS